MKNPAAAVICQGDVYDTPCNNGESIDIDKNNYTRQIMNGNAFWKCPICRGNAHYDDETSEKYQDISKEGGK